MNEGHEVMASLFEKYLQVQNSILDQAIGTHARMHLSISSLFSVDL